MLVRRASHEYEVAHSYVVVPRGRAAIGGEHSDKALAFRGVERHRFVPATGAHERADGVVTVRGAVRPGVVESWLRVAHVEVLVPFAVGANLWCSTVACAGNASEPRLIAVVSVEHCVAVSGSREGSKREVCGADGREFRAPPARAVSLRSRRFLGVSISSECSEVNPSDVVAASESATEGVAYGKYVDGGGATGRGVLRDVGSG